MKIDTSKLKTIASYARSYNGKGCSVQYIHKLIKAGSLETIKIDGVIFVTI